MEIVIAVLLFVSGYGFSEFIGDETAPVVTEVNSTVIEDGQQTTSTNYKRGHFVLSSYGYYITNLSPKPAEGCERPILTADLSRPMKDGETLPVHSVSVDCEG